MSDMEHCKTCRFWSEMIARAVPGTETEAVCLASGVYKGTFTRSGDSCIYWEEGDSIDSPHGDSGADS
jgi:hypothetical protein